MIKYENHCCSCAVPGYPCMGNSCPNVNVPVVYCDCCDDDVHAEYDIDGGHYCGDCAETYLKELFNELTLSEQAEVLGVEIKRLED